MAATERGQVYQLHVMLKLDTLMAGNLKNPHEQPSILQPA
jgi:hypothetical protein